MDENKIKKLEQIKSAVDFYRYKDEIIRELRGNADKKKVNKEDETKFNELREIKGIGEETIKDLKNAYRNDFEKFLFDLKSGWQKIPIRNDLARKIRDFYAEKELRG